MPGFVIDASATLPWRFEDEATPWTEALLERVEGGEEVRVPAHWPLEVTNTLLMARRSGRVTADQVTEFIEDLAALPIRIEPPSDPAQWPGDPRARRNPSADRVRCRVPGAGPTHRSAARHAGR
jgi:hypothetical protein